MALALEKLVDVLKTTGETTRFRLLVLLSAGDLTVSDLTDILGQSQPRISRHLKLLSEEGLIERYQEGAWAFFRLRQEGEAAALVRQLLKAVDLADLVLVRDGERLSDVKRERAARAQAYFSRNAAEWDELRRLHVSDEQVEKALAGLSAKSQSIRCSILEPAPAGFCSSFTPIIGVPLALTQAGICSLSRAPIWTAPVF